MSNMYVIGKSNNEFIKITHNATMYDGRKMLNEIQNCEHGSQLSDATIITDYEKAKTILDEIQNNIENIQFTNSSAIGEILDRENSFDKITYSKELKIYELVPIVVNH